MRATITFVRLICIRLTIRCNYMVDLSVKRRAAHVKTDTSRNMTLSLCLCIRVCVCLFFFSSSFVWTFMIILVFMAINTHLRSFSYLAVLYVCVSLFLCRSSSWPLYWFVYRLTSQYQIADFKKNSLEKPIGFVIICVAAYSFCWFACSV